MEINGKQVKVPKGYRRRKIPRVKRRAIAHTGGYREDIVWLRGR